MQRRVYGLIVDRKKKQLLLVRPPFESAWGLPMVTAAETDTGEEALRRKCRKLGFVVKVRRAIVALQGERSCPVAFTCRLLHAFPSAMPHQWVTQQELSNFQMGCPAMLRMAWDGLSVLEKTPDVSFDESVCVNTAYLLIPGQPYIYRQEAKNLMLLWKRLCFPQAAHRKK